MFTTEEGSDVEKEGSVVSGQSISKKKYKTFRKRKSKKSEGSVSSRCTLPSPRNNLSMRVANYLKMYSDQSNTMVRSSDVRVEDKVNACKS